MGVHPCKPAWLTVYLFNDYIFKLPSIFSCNGREESQQWEPDNLQLHKEDGPH